MKEDSDGPIRKSNRQRVPNSFYTEGINELKKNTRNFRESAKPAQKRNKVFEEDEDNSYGDEIIEDEKSYNEENSVWYDCRLPKDGSLIKVQFVKNQPERYAASVVEKVEKKKEEPPKVVKKAESSSFDLLSLFQKAIENVNVEVDNQKPAQSQPLAKEVNKKVQPVLKQKRLEDPEGRILQILYGDSKLILKHSKLGQVQVPIKGITESSTETEIDQDKVYSLRAKLQNLSYLSQISIFV